MDEWLVAVDGLVDCRDPDCCRQAVCVDSPHCHTAPDPLDILLRKQPPSSTSSFYDRVKFLIDDDSVQSYANRNSFDRRSLSLHNHMQLALLLTAYIAFCWRDEAAQLSWTSTVSWQLTAYNIISLYDSLLLYCPHFYIFTRPCYVIDAIISYGKIANFAAMLTSPKYSTCTLYSIVIGQRIILWKL